MRAEKSLTHAPRGLSDGYAALAHSAGTWGHDAGGEGKRINALLLMSGRVLSIQDPPLCLHLQGVGATQVQAWLEMRIADMSHWSHFD